MNEILYTIAKDIKGNLFTAQSAQKGVEYYCVNCNKSLVLKKSGMIGPRRKRPHFSHKSSTQNCQPETVLHLGFKTLVAEKLNQCLQIGNSMFFNWGCEYCGDKHVGNYIKKLKSIKVEYDLKFCKPDIALLDYNDTIFAAIEIVVTHKPTERVLNYYLENKIILIQINLKSEDDIYRIDEKLNEPDFVKFCLNQRCNVCNNFQEKFIMSIIDGKCKNCFKPMKIAIMKKGNNKFWFGPEKFNPKEIAFARQKGVMIDELYIKYLDQKYLVNKCQHCGDFLKKHSRLQNYFLFAVNNLLPIQDFFIKYNCSYCTEKKISDDNDWTQNLKW